MVASLHCERETGGSTLATAAGLVGQNSHHPLPRPPAALGREQLFTIRKQYSDREVQEGLAGTEGCFLTLSY